MKILAICTNTNQELVLQSIEAIDKIVKINSSQYYALFSLKRAEHYVQKLEKGSLYCLSRWLFSEAEKNKSMNFLDLYTKMLGLNHPAKLDVSGSIPVQKEDYSNTILIYPESNSFTDKEISNDFWIKIAEDLKSMGFNILFNAKANTYAHFKTIFLPMLEQIKMAQSCRYVIGMRSGFSDILAINDVKNHLVIYPKNIHFNTITREQQEKEFKRAFVMGADKIFEENMYRITSLKMFNDSAVEHQFTGPELLQQAIKDFVSKPKSRNFNQG